MNDIVPYKDIEAMANVMARTGMFGKTKDQMIVLMLIAQAEGKHPAIAAQEYDIIQGRPALNSKSALARFQTAGGSIQWKERTDRKAVAVFTHPQGGTLEVTWDMDRATRAGLAGKPTWKQYPAQMLSARVIAEGVRAVYPACLSGMYTKEEVQDIPDLPEQEGPKDVTPPAPPTLDPGETTETETPQEKRDRMIASISDEIKKRALPKAFLDEIRARIKSAASWDDLDAILEEVKRKPLPEPEQPVPTEKTTPFKEKLANFENTGTSAGNTAELEAGLDQFFPEMGIDKSKAVDAELGDYLRGNRWTTK